MKIFNLICILLVLIFFNCSQSTEKEVHNKLTDNSENIISFDLYNFEKPDNIIYLPNSLSEISGISLLDENRILCVQDEKGFVYVFDLKEQKITEKIKFGKKGDYEDIQLVDSTVYVLESNGILIKIKNLLLENIEIERIETGLQTENNTEGLCYENKTKSLLIACKESPSLPNSQQKHHKKRAIYRFDLQSNTLVSEPFCLLKKELKYNNQKKIDIYPSAININPITGDLYTLSSVGKCLIISNLNGDIKNIIELNPSIFQQPEGICFAKNGDLFISNEAKGRIATICKFKVIKK